MNRKDLILEIERFKKREEELKSLKPGDFIYEMNCADPFGFSYFKHEVVSVDLNDLYVNTLDHSLNMKPSKLYSYHLESDLNL
jgi:hypothetical protein